MLRHARPLTEPGQVQRRVPRTEASLSAGAPGDSASDLLGRKTPTTRPPSLGRLLRSGLSGSGLSSACPVTATTTVPSRSRVRVGAGDPSGRPSSSTRRQKTAFAAWPSKSHALKMSRNQAIQDQRTAGKLEASVRPGRRRQPSSGPRPVQGRLSPIRPCVVGRFPSRLPRAPPSGCTQLVPC